MATEYTLGEFEQVVLLTALRLGRNAYSLTIRDEIRNRTGREPSPGALYTTLDRLEEKGLLKSHLGDPTPQRGGRAKRYFELSGTGLEAAHQAQRSWGRLLEGLQFPGTAHA